MKNVTTIFFTLSLLGGIFSCQEDTIDPALFGTLTGQVLLESDNSPLAGVTISTTPPSSTVLSDATGKFVFENLKTGTYTVRAEKPDLTSGVESVTIFEDKITDVVIKMKVKEGVNAPPSQPDLLFPANGSDGHPISLTLSWDAADENEDDVLTYDVYLFNSNQSPGAVIAHDVEDKSFVVNDLKYGTTYFWQIAVKDGTAAPVFSEVWSFSTGPFPAHPFVFAKVNNGKYDIFAAQSGSTSVPLYLLTTMPGSNFRPRISPEGSKIAFLSNNFPNTQLYIMKRDGSDVALVPAPVPVDGSDKFQLDFCWSPDGTKLLFMNKNYLYRTNLDGSGFEIFTQLPPGEEFVEVDWSGISDRVAARTVGDQPYKSRILLYDSNGSYLQEIVGDTGTA